jgi:uncharacterized protein
VRTRLDGQNSRRRVDSVRRHGCTRERAWVLDRQPAGDAGVLVYIRVNDVEASLQKIVEAGGEVTVPRTLEGQDLACATFRDPAGNVLGIFQEGGS